MNEQPTPQGLEPVASVEAPAPPVRTVTIRDSIRMNVRGRSVRLRGLRRQPTGLLRWLVILGPGLIAAS